MYICKVNQQVQKVRLLNIKEKDLTYADYNFAGEEDARG